MNVTVTSADLVRAVVCAAMLCLPASAQSGPSLPVFESASVKPAPADAPTQGLEFMIALGQQVPPRGLLTMTGPLAPLIVFAYNVQDEVEARSMRSHLPEWAQRMKYTVVARATQDSPTQEQLRFMMRSLLEDRFALQAHHAVHTGAVDLLVTGKEHVTGPKLKAHPASEACEHRTSNVSHNSALARVTSSTYCGLLIHQGADGIFHVRMVDVTIPEACTLLGGLGGVLGGRAMTRIVDATHLQGRWDLSLDFLPEREGLSSDAQPVGNLSGPSFSSALQKQLGLRLEKGTGDLDDLIIDRISPPSAD